MCRKENGVLWSEKKRVSDRRLFQKWYLLCNVVRVLESGYSIHERDETNMKEKKGLEEAIISTTKYGTTTGENRLGNALFKL